MNLSLRESRRDEWGNLNKKYKVLLFKSIQRDIEREIKKKLIYKSSIK